jgi:hypothetical protein
MVKYFLIFGLCLLLACKSSNSDLVTKNCIEKAGNGLLILNEGNYGWGISDYSYWQTGSAAINNLYQCQNSGKVLGNVGQSIYQDPNTKTIYLVINNSGKVVTLNHQTLAVVNTYTIGGSPRYIAASDSFLFVSDLYAGAISVFRKTDFSLVSKISTPHPWSEEIYLTDNGYFITRQLVMENGVSQSHLIQTFKAQPPFELTASFNQAGHFSGLIEDGKGGFYAISRSSLQEGDKLLHLKISSNGSIIKTETELPYHADYDTTRVQRLAFSEGENKLFYTRNHLYCVKLGANDSIVGQVIKVKSAQNSDKYYGLYASPSFPSSVFLTNAKDYVQNGMVYQIDAGTLKTIDSTSVGVIPQAMFWLP